MPTVTADVVGGSREEVALPPGATYGDLLAALDLSPHEAAVLVDGDPVPEDRRVDPDTDEVRVLRLVKGGRGTTEDRTAVRPAAPDDHLDVMRIVDGAALAADADAIRERIERGEALVATVDGSVVGALVRDGGRVTAVAVRRRWRDRGIGRALVVAALDDCGRLVAAFDSGVRPFYASLGFEIERGDDGRLRGTLEQARDGGADGVGPVEQGDGEDEHECREIPREPGERRPEERGGAEEGKQDREGTPHTGEETEDAREDAPRRVEEAGVHQVGERDVADDLEGDDNEAETGCPVDDCRSPSGDVPVD
jgi:sulfur carrier protein ThiS/predicted N-acetyltransferase YhbS